MEFTQLQIKSIIDDVVSKKDGLNAMMKMTLEALCILIPENINSPASLNSTEFASVACLETVAVPVLLSFSSPVELS